MSPLIQWTATDNGTEELIACFIGEPEANLSLSFPKNTTKWVLNAKIFRETDFNFEITSEQCEIASK